jgi:hypothetical protein
MAEVNVVHVFNADPSKQGSKEAVDAAVARQLVREGRARYATDAQERKAESAPVEK